MQNFSTPSLQDFRAGSATTRCVIIRKCMCVCSAQPWQAFSSLHCVFLTPREGFVFLLSKLLLLSHTISYDFAMPKCSSPAGFEVPLLNSDCPKSAFWLLLQLHFLRFIIGFCLYDPDLLPHFLTMLEAEEVLRGWNRTCVIQAAVRLLWGCREASMCVCQAGWEANGWGRKAGCQKCGRQMAELFIWA